LHPVAKTRRAKAARAAKEEGVLFIVGVSSMEAKRTTTCIERKRRAQGYIGMGRKRDLKNVHPKRPPAMPADDPEALNEWGEELHRMTEKRRRTHEQHKPGRSRDR